MQWALYSLKLLFCFPMRIIFVEMCIQDPVITFEHAGQVQPQLMETVLQKLCEKQSFSTHTEGKLIGTHQMPDNLTGRA